MLRSRFRWPVGVGLSALYVTGLVAAQDAMGPAPGSASTRSEMHPVASAISCATPGKDGPAGVLSGVVDTYLPGTATAAAGDRAISVGSATGPAPVGAGDLLLVIQMQDAAIAAPNSDAYGSGTPGTGSGSTNLNASGSYEYVEATGAVTLGSVPIAGAGVAGGLEHTYTAAAATATQGQRSFQVVRVPQYSTATLGSTLTALPWNGTVGGILALDVAGTLDLGNAQVSLDGAGFRGGGGRLLTGDATLSSSAIDYVNLSSVAAHGQKGEGLAGTPAYVVSGGAVVATGQPNDGYPGGSSARGAPGNAGGGGTDSEPLLNDENSGGGGGGNRSSRH